MNEEQPVTPEEMASLMASSMGPGTVGLVMINQVGPPDPGEAYLALMRQMIDETGSATGCISFGTQDASGMMPLVDVDAQDGLRLLIMMRQMDMINPVAWVTLATDTFRRIFRMSEVDPATVRHGDIEKMRQAGDTEVEDALMVCTLAPDGPSCDLAQPYVKTETGVEWGEVETNPPSQGGGVVDLMRELVRT